MSTAAQSCFSTLRQAILDGRYPAGERLPPERRLADELGVGRVTVRSALTRLSAANLLSVRQGSGYVVRDFRRNGGPDLLAGVAELAGRSGAFVDVARDLLLVRRHLAGAVLGRLAERPPTADHLVRITAAIEAFARAAEAGADDDTLAARDLDVLSALLDATGSAVLGLCINPISAALGDLPRLRQVIYAEPTDNALGWRALAFWLADPSRLPVEALVAQLEARDAAALERLRT
ncbi:MAG: GntR family transcriptional regulator [Myxococcota bacterium]|jgi:DNA-binding FadR family transcriptional regulator|nr:GntR family transcriptional regulator [Myxococcota bacterium]